MTPQLPGWFASLAVLIFLALLIRLWWSPRTQSPWLAAALLILFNLVGFHWIFTSLHVYGLMAAPIAATATLLLALYVSLFTLAAGWFIRRHKLRPLAVACVITLAELLRGYLFTGFPWLNWGYLQLDSLLAGFAPVFGVYGLVFLAALCAAWLARLKPGPALAVLSLHLAGGIGLSIEWTRPLGEPLRVALIQPSIDQRMKFDPAHAKATERSLLELLAVATPASAGKPLAADLVVLPETAFIDTWQRLKPETQELLQRLVDRSGSAMITGLPLRDTNGWSNSAIALKPKLQDQNATEPPPESRAMSSAPVQPQRPSQEAWAYRYDKHHLVPFGEFIPWGFQWFVDLMQVPLGSFRSGPLAQPAFLIQDQAIGLNICFEDLFGEELIAALQDSRPASQPPSIWLNLSNLAWFGDSIALQQHLNVGRMRSLETGRPMLRATNTGLTAIVDAKGRVQKSLQSQDRDILLGQVQGMTGATPFNRWGNAAVFVLVALATLAAWLEARRRQRRAER